MNVVLLSRRRFDELWRRLEPQRRLSSGTVKSPNLFIFSQNTLVLIEEEVRVGKIDWEYSEELTLHSFLMKVENWEVMESSSFARPRG